MDASKSLKGSKTSAVSVTLEIKQNFHSVHTIYHTCIKPLSTLNSFELKCFSLDKLTSGKTLAI